MGCGASSPAAVEAPAEDENVNGNGNHENHSPRRARSSGGHLHHKGEVAFEETETTSQTSHHEDEDPEAKASYTRQRRLSHVRTAVHREAEEALDADLGKAKLDKLVTVEHLLKECVDEGPPPTDLLIACATRAGDEPGYRKTNQDAFAVHEKFASTAGSFFAVFDGHGPNGHLVSGLAKGRLPAHLISTAETRAALFADPGESLKRAFSNVDDELNETSGIDIEYSGSTAVACVLRGKTLTTAWCGDSRAVLARETGGRMEVVPLTTDHKPNSPGELERIDEEGGRVARLQDESGEEVGPHRVWLRYAWIPGLAMSRALGDALAHRVGVSSDPEISTHEIDASDRFLILASDGIWEFITNEEAVMIAASCNSPDEAASKLVAEAHSRWVQEEDGIVDDITVVVVAFSHKS